MGSRNGKWRGQRETELEGLGYSKNMVILFIFSFRKKGWKFLESWVVAQGS